MDVKLAREILELSRPTVVQIGRELGRTLVMSVKRLGNDLFAGDPVSIEVGRYPESDLFACRIIIFETKEGFLQDPITKFRLEAFRASGPIEETGFSGFHVHGVAQPEGSLEGWTGRYNVTPDWV